MQTELEEGYFLLSRKMFESWAWRDEPYMMALWIHLIFKANFKDQVWRNEVIKRGQFLTTLSRLSEDSGLSIQQIRTRLEILVNNKQITIKSTNKYRIITICKYDDYQLTPDFYNKQITNKQQTNNKQLNKSNKYNINNSLTRSACACEEEDETGKGRLIAAEKDKERELASEHEAALYCSQPEERYLEELKSNKQWKEMVCMNRHLTEKQLDRMLDAFHRRCQEQMKRHDNCQDYCAHFINTLNDGADKQQQRTATTNDRRSYEVSDEKTYSETF